MDNNTPDTEEKICGVIVTSNTGMKDGHACFNKRPCPIHTPDTEGEYKRGMKYGIQYKGKMIHPHLHDTLRTGETPFRTFDEAKRWGVMNYKGNTDNWRVVGVPEPKEELEDLKHLADEIYIHLSEVANVDKRTP